jgi:uridine kinase
LTKPYIIGISGGSGSGKTTFIKELTKNFSSQEVCVISLDHYYKPQSDQPRDDNGIPNYDTPSSIDIEAFLLDLEHLKSGKEVQKLEYDFNNPSFSPKLLTFSPSKVIILEGVFVFCYPSLTKYIDFKIFMDTSEHLRVKRRIVRDLHERGYPIEDTLYFLEYHEAPGFRKYVEPYRQDCDIIIPNNQHFKQAIQMIDVFVKSKLK